MKNIISILNKSNSESFILLDEICAGTDPVEGALLAKAILEKLSELGVTGVVTTHYGELKALEGATAVIDISLLIELTEAKGV